MQVCLVADNVIKNNAIRERFEEYCKAYEAKEEIKLSEEFNVDKRAVSLPKKVRTIKLDDTIEIHLKKSGNFIERGFDEGRGLSYYKFYFSKEK